MEKKILLIAVMVIAAWSGAHAQVQEWDTDGNAAPSGSVLGTTNNLPLPFITNNVERMRISEDGYVGIGNNNPRNFLTITSPGVMLPDPYDFLEDCAYPNYAPHSSYGIISFMARDNGYNRAVHGVGFRDNQKNIGGVFYGRGDRTNADSTCTYNYGVGGVAFGNGYSSTNIGTNTGAIGGASGLNADNTGGMFFAENEGCTGETFGIYATASGGQSIIGVYAEAENPGECEVDQYNGTYDKVLAAFFSGNTLTTGNAYVLSDARFKRNKEAIASPSDLLSKIKVYSYNYTNNPNIKLAGKSHFGVMAQEVEQVLPDLVIKFRTPEINSPVLKKHRSSEEIMAVNYNEFIPLLIGAHNEQRASLGKVEETIENQAQEINSLKEELRVLKDLLKSVCEGGCGQLKNSNGGLGESLRCYPNPATNKFLVNLDNLKTSEQYILNLSDNSGNVVYTQRLSGKDMAQEEINIDRLVSGTYTVVLYSSRGVVSSSTVVIQK